MSSALSALARRACAVFEAVPTALHTATEGTEQLRCLAVSCNALCMLSSTSNSDDAIAAAAAAAATTQQLLAALTALPPSRAEAPAVMQTLFRAVQRSAGLVPNDTRARLLRQLDERVNPAFFTLWGPHQQLKILHTVAKIEGPSRTSAGSSTGVGAPLGMLDDLLLCLGQELGKLNEAESATLLWSLATLRLQTHPLWAATCSRCTVLLHRMSGVSRATTLYAVLMVEGRAGAAQHQLMHALATGAWHAREHGNNGRSSHTDCKRQEPFVAAEADANMAQMAGVGGEGAVWFNRRGMDAPTWAGEGSGSGSGRGAEGPEHDYHDGADADVESAVRSRLFHDARELDTDMLLSLLRTSMGLQRESFPLIRELGHRRDMRTDQAAAALLDVVIPLSVEVCAPEAPVDRSVPPYAERLLSLMTATALDVLQRADPRGVREPERVALGVAAILVRTGSRANGSHTHAELLLPLEMAAQLPRLLLTYARETLRRHRASAVDVLPGDALWALVAALDVAAGMGADVAVVGAGGMGSVSDADTAAVRDAKAAWGRRGVSIMYEQSAAFVRACCACPPALSSCTPANNGSSNFTLGPYRSPATLSVALLAECVDALERAPQLPIPIVTSLLAALAGGDGHGQGPPFAVAALLAPLARRLVLVLEMTSSNAMSRRALLKEVGTLLACYPVRTNDGVNGEPASHAPPAADALLDLFVRCLLDELQSLSPQPPKRSGVSAVHADVLVRCLQQRSRAEDGGVALERGFQVLCTRRLGQKESLLRAVQLPPSHLAALIELADKLNARAASTPATAAAQALRAGMTAAILAELLGHVLPAETGAVTTISGTSEESITEGAVAQCTDLASLNDVASLLSLSVCTELGLQQRLAKAIDRCAVRLMRRRDTPPQDRAMLIAYFVRAGLEPSEELLKAIHQ